MPPCLEENKLPGKKASKVLRVLLLFQFEVYIDVLPFKNRHKHNHRNRPRVINPEQPCPPAWLWLPLVGFVRLRGTGEAAAQRQSQNKQYVRCTEQTEDTRAAETECNQRRNIGRFCLRFVDRSRGHPDQRKPVENYSTAPQCTRNTDERPTSTYLIVVKVKLQKQRRRSTTFRRVIITQPRSSVYMHPDRFRERQTSVSRRTKTSEPRGCRSTPLAWARPSQIFVHQRTNTTLGSKWYGKSVSAWRTFVVFFLKTE